MKSILKKFVLALTFAFGLTLISVSENEVKAESAQDHLPNNAVVSIFPYINVNKVLTIDIGGKEGNIVTLWDETWSGNMFVPQQHWRAVYDGTRGNNVVLLKSLYNNSVLAWDVYGVRKIIAQPYNYTDRQYWIVEPFGKGFKLRSYYNKNYVLTVPSAPYYNGVGMTVYPDRGDKYQEFGSVTW